MPELPEVETFKRYLDATSLHQRIVDIDVRSAYLLKGISRRDLVRQLKGRCFEWSRRHGKHLFVRVESDIWLRLHFGMTGSLHYFKGEEKTPPHTRVLFLLAKGYRLAFEDQRKFGAIAVTNDVDDFLKQRELGPDALDLDFAQFKEILDKHRGAMKSVLMNQKLIAGIGNLYVDEILFHACIHPAFKTWRLDDKRQRQLFRAMRYVLQKAIDYQADGLPKSWLLPHRGKAGKCPRCGRELKSARIGGRTTWFCSHCQRH
jgi:formamidopyrimidine-DNA glycosylase